MAEPDAEQAPGPETGPAEVAAGNADIVIGSVPIHGHVTPLLTVAAGLVERGHRVRFLTGARFADTVRRTGAEFVALPAGSDFDDRTLHVGFDRQRPPGIRGLRFDVREVFLKPARGQYEALRDLIADPTDAVLVDPTFAGALMLIAAPGPNPPVVVAGVLPLTLSSATVPPFGLGLAPLANPILNRARNAALRLLVQRVIFAPVQQEAEQMFLDARSGPLDVFVLDWVSRADAIAQFTVPSFEYPRPDAPVPVRFVGPLSSTSDLPLPSWWGDLEAGAPVVLVTQGTIANRDLTELIRPTLDGLAEEDLVVVVTTGGRPVADLGPLPANARAAEFLPYDQLFPRLAAVVTNGGYGGVQYALAHAVPLVVAGAGEDKPEVAARVAWSGVGMNLRTGRPKPADVRRAVREVLEQPQYRAAAERASLQIAAASGVDGLVQLITDLRGDDVDRT